MATTDGQQTWVPYVPTKDCSMGFCSIYCPQWCYVVFPPPPPIDFPGESSGLSLSPLVIVIVGVLAGALLLVCYYSIVSKYCGSFDSFRRWLHPPGDNDHRELDDSTVVADGRHEAWQYASPSDGLDETLINKIAVHKYRRGDAAIAGTDCSVCLSEFREDDSLRLLPKCSHAFHLQCIDTWLRSHSNCPLCRANIALLNPAAAPPETSVEVEEPAPATDEIAIMMEDAVGVEDGTESESGNEADAIVEIRDDELLRPGGGRISIADVLQMSMEDELLAAKESGVWVGAPSSSRRAGGCGGDHRKNRGLHCVISPVPMKRSFSGGRFCLTRYARGRNGNPGQRETSE